MATTKRRPAGRYERWFAKPGEEGGEIEVRGHVVNRRASLVDDDYEPTPVEGLAPVVADSHLRAIEDAARPGAPRGPLGASSTVIPDPSVVNRNLVLEDAAVHIGGEPTINPTAASGNASAPAANAVVADSGALAAGTYYVEVSLGFSGTLAAGKHLQIEHRNAANNATVNTLGMCPAGVSTIVVRERVVVALNERIRVVIGAVAAAASEVAIAEVRVYKLVR